MCGRYALDLGGGELAKLLGFPGDEISDFSPRWNIAPTTAAPVLAASGREVPRFELARWGIVPPWRPHGTPGRPLINARAETVFEKPAFQSAARAGRCIVPARCFYEWRRSGRRRDPFAIGRVDGGLMCFAGVFERGGATPGFAIVTTGANATIAGIHDRMPVILDESGVDEWLEPRDPEVEIGSWAPRLLRPASADLLSVRRVGDRVNDARRDGPDLLDPPVEEDDLFGGVGCSDDPDP